MILFDTSILSLAFRRASPESKERRIAEIVAELLTGEASLGLPAIVLQEVLSGIRSEEQFTDLERRLRAAFDVMIPTAEDHIAAARLKNQCLSKGISASGPDCLIAAQTLNGAHELFTTDPDFTAIAKVVPLKLYQPFPNQR